MAAERELTFGEEAVGITFNPSGNEKVQKLKELYAEIINLVDNHPANEGMGANISDEAILTAISAQMWCVKAVTYKS